MLLFNHSSVHCVTANLNCLGSVREDVQYPVAECGNQAQSVKMFQSASRLRLDALVRVRTGRDVVFDVMEKTSYSKRFTRMGVSAIGH